MNLFKQKLALERETRQKERALKLQRREAEAQHVEEGTASSAEPIPDETASPPPQSPPSPPLASSQHLGGSRQYWRDVILGVNDGLVSTFLLVASVTGGGLASTDILLTAIAGALAGAVSMCSGEYVATKSQNEVWKGEIALEQGHVQEYLDDELSELGDLLQIIGIDDDDETQTSLRQDLLDYYRDHPQALLKIMVALEFGVISQEARSPLRAGLTSCLLFILGSLPSVVPFIFVDDDNSVTGLIAAAIVTTVALLLVGAIKTWATRGNCLTAAVENLLIAGLGGVFAYAVGVAFDQIFHE